MVVEKSLFLAWFFISLCILTMVAKKKKVAKKAPAKKVKKVAKKKVAKKKK
jgi:hypothetical protein